MGRPIFSRSHCSTVRPYRTVRLYCARYDLQNCTTCTTVVQGSPIQDGNKSSVAQGGSHGRCDEQQDIEENLESERAARSLRKSAAERRLEELEDALDHMGMYLGPGGQFMWTSPPFTI
eukprot:SAG25_NODE_2583_length_1515_cov_4.945621_2_plen_119_part_00